MNKMKTKKMLATMLSLVLCFTMIVPVPVFAANGNGKGNGNGNGKSGKHEIYAENEAIVCYVDSADVDQEALEEEIITSNSDEDLESVESVEPEISEEASEQLELVEMVDSADELADLGDKSIKKMKGIKKGIHKAKKAKEGKAGRKIGLLKSKKYSTEELVEILNELPNVEYAEPNYYETPTADYTGNQWAYKASLSNYGMKVPHWNENNFVNAEGVVVAVLDTGIDYNNEDLRDVIWSGGNIPELTSLGGGEHGINTSASTSSAMKNPMDEHGHGTHCAGIIGAAWNGFGVSGAANGVKIMAVKAGKSGFYTSDLVEGMEYILAAKKAGVNVVAVNNSWGGDPRSSAESYVDCMKELGKAGVISVFAAGNESDDCDANYGSRLFPKYYQAYFFKDLDCKIVVNSSDKYGAASSFSNYGKTTTDVYAPGSSIYSTYLSNDGSYASMSGTSMATPAVVGEVAILAANNPKASIQDIISAVKKNVTPGTKNIKACTSGGYANVEAALNALGGTGGGTVEPAEEYDVTYSLEEGTTGTCPDGQKKTENVALTLRPNPGDLAKPSTTATGTSYVTVTLNANGGSQSASRTSYSTTTTKYTASGWVTTDGRTNYSFGGTYTTNAPLALKPRWSTSTSTSYAAVTLPTAEEMTRSGYTLSGFATKSSGSVAYKPGASYTPTKSVTLYAKWTQVKKTNPTVTVKPTIVTSASYNGEPVKLINNPGSVSGGTLSYAKGTSSYTAPSSGWDTNPDNITATASGTYYVWYKVTGDATHNNINATKIGSVRVTKQAARYTVTYYKGDATSGTVPDPQIKTEGVTLTLSPNPGNFAKNDTKSEGTQVDVSVRWNNGTTQAFTYQSTPTTTTKYSASGWATIEGGSKAYSWSGSYTGNANLDLYPAWDKTTLTTYSSVTLPTATALTRNGYTLLGFSTSSTATTATYQPGASYTPTGAVTLYAVWKSNSTPAPSPTAPKATSISRISTTRSNVTVTWARVTGITGYEVQYATSSSFSGSTTYKASSSSTSYSFKSTKNKTYYVRIRTYLTSSGNTAYSNWSSTKSIKSK